MRLHDSLSRSLREVVPGPDGILRFYSCGPTVHDHAHVGNCRYFVWVDVLKRVALARGLAVRHVMNVTDVEDKIIARARAAGLDVRDPAKIPEYTARYERAFRQDLEALRILPADEYPRATEFVAPMIAFVERLVERGHAYESDGSVYFRIATFPSYGRLSRFDPGTMKPGARVDSDEYEKDDVRDFVLWKAAKEGEPRWDSPWGPGRPGWHLECSVMALRCLGADTIDVHAGGEDLLFPHHENEIAQSEGATGQPFCRIWVHGAHLRVDDRKMSKSLGNFHTLRELVDQGHDPVAIRYALASTHYRAPMNLSRDVLEGAARAVDRLNEFARLVLTATPAASPDTALAAAVDAAARSFDAALDDDLNTSGALGSAFGAVRDVNAAVAAKRAGADALEAARRLLGRVDAVFAVLPTGGLALEALAREVDGKRYEVTAVGSVPAEVLEAVVRRQEARAAKDFAGADRLRDELTAGGWVVEDVPGGARVKRAS